MALELIAGATFGVLYDRVSRKVDERVTFKAKLKAIKRTMDFLKEFEQAEVIREIGDFNEELSLRNDVIHDLETQIIEGTSLVSRLSSLDIFTMACCCPGESAELLDELHRSLENLLETLRLQTARDVKEILKLLRKNHDDLDEMKQLVRNLTRQLNAYEDNGETSAPDETSTENETNAEEQGGSPGGALQAACLVLSATLLEVKDKSVMYGALLGSLMSTLRCLEPLIQDMAQSNGVLHLPVKELEYFRMHVDNGAELVRKCSRNGLWAKCKKKKYTDQLLGLDAFLHRQLIALRLQVARDVRETTASTRSLQKMIRQIQVGEPSSSDEENDGLVSASQVKAVDIGVEGSDVVQEKTDVTDCFEVPEPPLFKMDVALKDMKMIKQIDESGVMKHRAGMIADEQNESDVLQEKSEIPNWFEVPEPPLFTVGLDVALKEMKKKLLEDWPREVGVFGAGGVGKTTLVRMLCHDREVKDKFKNIFYITASKWPNLNLSMQGLHQALCSQVPTFQHEEGRHYLVVLDDVWPGSESTLQDCDGLKIPNSKILITTRNEFPGVGFQYYLNSLNNEDAMSLFHFSLGDGSSYIPEDLSRKTVECCKGLPLALAVMGKLLCCQSTEIWQKALAELESSSSISDLEPQMIVHLQRSLAVINREKSIIKECFLDIASFSPDQIVPAAALIDMWAELYGQDEKVCSIANLRKLSSHALVNIVSRKEEIQVDGYNSDVFVTQHHLLRGLAIHEASMDTIDQRKRLIIDIHGNNLPRWWMEQKCQPKNARLLSISTDLVFSRKWQYMQLPKLQVLVLNFQSEKYELPGFLDKLDKLKVVLATNKGSSPAELSNFRMLGSLPKLKAIRLEGVASTSITKNPIQLVCLKKIVFSKCDMAEAFSNSSFQFSLAFPNIVDLNLDHCHDLEELPADLGNLSNLEMMYISNCHKLSTLPEGIGNLSKLKRLRVRYGTNFISLPGSITKLNSLESLDISGCIKFMGFPEGIGQMSRLRRINLSGCSRLKELPRSTLSLEHLQEVILDEETTKLSKPFLLKNIDTRVLVPVTAGIDVASEELCCMKVGMSRLVPDVLHIRGVTMMDGTLILKLIKQFEGISVVKDQCGKLKESVWQIEGMPVDHIGNNIACCSSSSTRESQLWRRAKSRESQNDKNCLRTLRHFTLEELKVATGNFRSDRIIHRGSSGNIYKGWVDEKTLAPSKVGCGMPLAVKKLNPGSKLDHEEWELELNFRGRTSHPNLVKLLGYCREENEMLFVYEYMQNGSLEDHLFGSSSGVETLSWDWNYILDIASGIAQALIYLDIIADQTEHGRAYLHSSDNQITHRGVRISNTMLDFNSQAPKYMLNVSGDARIISDNELVPRASLENHHFERCPGMEHQFRNIRLELASEAARGLYLHSYSQKQVVYCDLKASNILLDENYNAKLSNFGLKRLNETGELLDQSTHCVGTSLYITPEECTTGRSYPESDMYGFGVLLLQLLTGSRTIESALVNQRKLETIMCERIENQCTSEAASRVAQITMKCLASEQNVRPSIREVAEELEQIFGQWRERKKQSKNTTMPSSERQD